MLAGKSYMRVVGDGLWVVRRNQAIRRRMEAGGPR